MPGLGTLINVGAIIAGGCIGLAFGSFLKERWQQTIIQAVAVSTMFLGAAGTLSKMLRTGPSGSLETGGTMMMILSLVLGTLIGEILDIDGKFERFGEWLKVKSGSLEDQAFVGAFVTASLTVCIGAMAIMGAIQDGISADHSVLAAKSILDFIIILIMASSMGKGAVFSAIPVGVLQGGVTLLSRAIAPVMTEPALANLSLVGNILIFCVGINLMKPGTIRVANMLPAIVLAVAFAFFGMT